jgi:hypothetical protein
MASFASVRTLLNLKNGQPYMKPVNVYSVSGAITFPGGVAKLTKAGVGVMTLKDPAKEDDGLTLEIYSETAQAHTVTNTTGFNGGGTGSDVGTFGGAIGDGFTLVARNGIWWVTNNVNVTLA